MSHAGYWGADMPQESYICIDHNEDCSFWLSAVPPNGRVFRSEFEMWLPLTYRILQVEE